jgi:hypothetical protein
MGLPAGAQFLLSQMVLRNRFLLGSVLGLVLGLISKTFAHHSASFGISRGGRFESGSFGATAREQLLGATGLAGVTMGTTYRGNCWGNCWDNEFRIRTLAWAS